MRFLTHNSLKCLAKEATTGYPLRIEIAEMNVVETECNVEFIKHILPSLIWPAVLIAAEAIQLEGMPAEFSADMLNDPDFVLAIHRLLLDVHVVGGVLICPDTGRRFEIRNGIPNMRYFDILVVYF